jgi:hypothetical protein
MKDQPPKMGVRVLSGYGSHGSGSWVFGVWPENTCPAGNRPSSRRISALLRRNHHWNCRRRPTGRVLHDRVSPSSDLPQSPSISRYHLSALNSLSCHLSVSLTLNVSASFEQKNKEEERIEEKWRKKRRGWCVGLEIFLPNNPQPHTWLWIRPNLSLTQSYPLYFLNCNFAPI